MAPCSFTTAGYGIDVRTIRTQADIAELPARFRAMQRARRSVQCDDCLSTQICDKFERPSGPMRPLLRSPASQEFALQN